jgi:hypothetical protein
MTGVQSCQSQQTAPSSCCNFAVPRPSQQLLLLWRMCIAFSNVNLLEMLCNCLVCTSTAQCGSAAGNAGEARQARHDEECVPEAVRSNALMRVAMSCCRLIIQPACQPCGQQVAPSSRRKLQTSGQQTTHSQLSQHLQPWYHIYRVRMLHSGDLAHAAPQHI